MKKDEFIQALRQALISQNTSDIEEIISDFEDHFAAAVQEGKSEEEIADMLGQPEQIAEQYPTALAYADQLHFSGPPVSNTPASDTPVSDQPPAADSGQPSLASQRPITDQRYPGKVETGSNVSANSKSKADHSPKYVRADLNGGTPVSKNAEPDSTPVNYPQPNQEYVQKQVSGQPENQGSIDSGKVIALIIINLFIMIPLVCTIFGILIGFWSASIGVGVGGAALFAVAVLQQGVQVQILVLFGLSLTALCFLLLIASYYLTKASILGLIKYIRWNGTWVKEKKS